MFYSHLEEIRVALLRNYSGYNFLLHDTHIYRPANSYLAYVLGSSYNWTLAGYMKKTWQQQSMRILHLHFIKTEGYLGRMTCDNGEKVGPMPGLYLWFQPE